MPDVVERLTAALRDHYDVERQIGEGGMATVFLAQDLKHRRKVAIKVFRPELAATIGSDRFLREVELAARLQHPHIVPVFDSGSAPDAASGTDPGTTSGTAGEMLYYVMPFIEGESLRDRLSRERQLPVEESVRLVREVASALAYAHGHGIVHRDIKPENIMLTGGHAVVADFGIARAIDAAAVGGAPRSTALTGLGFAIGTPAYMSPEQATASDEVDGRTDQYSLACVLFEMLAGEPAFRGTSAQSIITKSVTGPRPKVRGLRRSVPAALDAVVTRALARDPAGRYPDMAAFSEALGTALAAGGRARRPVLLGAAVGMLLALALGGWWLIARPARGAVVEEAQRIAVLPFNTSGPNVQYMGEGMVDLLSTNLNGVGGVRTVEPRAVLARWRKRDGATADLQDALAVGREVDAGAVLLGSVVAAGPRVRLTAELYSQQGERLAQAQSDGATDSVLSLVDDLSLKLMREIWRSREPLPALHAGGLLTSSVDAMRAYLKGEQHYRRSEFDSAAAAFTRAVEQDSTFALAHYRFAMSQGWVGNFGDPAALRASEAAAKYSARLPERERALVVGYQLFQRGSLAAVDSMRRYVAQHPRDADGWYLLGEAQYHTKQAEPYAPATLRAPFDSVLAIDPSLTPAVLHPIEVVITQRDSAGFARYLRLMREAGDDDEARTIEALGILVWGPASRRDSAFRTVLRTPRGGIANALFAWRLSDPTLNPDSVLAGSRRDVERFATDDRLRGQLRFAHSQLLAALGRYEELEPLADGLMRSSRDLGMGSVLVPVMTGTATPGMRRRFEAEVNTAPPTNPFGTWMRAALELVDGDAAGARAHLARLRAMDSTKVRPEFQRLVTATEGWAMLVAGDTVRGTVTMEREFRALGGYNDWQFIAQVLRYQMALGLAAQPATRERGVRWLRYGFDGWTAFVPHTQFALGKAYQAAGQRDEAAEAYGRFIRLWSTADAALQPRVVDARQSLQELAAERP